MKKNVNIIIFNLDLEVTCDQEITSRFGNDESVNLDTVRFYKEVNNCIKEKGNAILLFKIENKAEFVQVLAILKANSRLIESGLLKPACLLGVKSNKLERLLFKYGCRDILDINVNPRTLVIKTEMWVRSISNILNKGDDFLTLGQRSQKGDSSSGSKYKMKSLPEVDFCEDEEQLEEELNELVEELENEDEDLELDSLMEELDDGEIKEEGLKEEESPDLHIVTNEESSPELVGFINASGDPSLLNLETGYLGLALEGQENADCIFENFEEDHMILEVPENYYAVEGERLSVFVKFIYNKCKVELELTGAVSEIEKLEDGRKHLNVTFDQAEVERYDYFMSLYEKRQKSINDFMELAKGY